MKSIAEVISNGSLQYFVNKITYRSNHRNNFCGLCIRNVNLHLQINPEHESFAGFSGILMLYVMLRYLETGGKKYLYLMAASLVLHFTAKETAFIYSAQALLYLAIYFIARITRAPWEGRIHLGAGHQRH